MFFMLLTSISYLQTPVTPHTMALAISN